ncbi:hypothetical protein C8T65DRAFT_674318 [Cerioporus squamosus]|nr:hypothetical protein C8T65DRAFT_674318 [Cerioporus squamosus]
MAGGVRLVGFVLPPLSSLGSDLSPAPGFVTWCSLPAASIRRFGLLPKAQPAFSARSTRQRTQRGPLEHDWEGIDYASKDQELYGMDSNGVYEVRIIRTYSSVRSTKLVVVFHLLDLRPLAQHPALARRLDLVLLLGLGLRELLNIVLDLCGDVRELLNVVIGQRLAERHRSGLRPGLGYHCVVDMTLARTLRVAALLALALLRWRSSGEHSRHFRLSGGVRRMLGEVVEWDNTDSVLRAPRWRGRLERRVWEDGGGVGCGLSALLCAGVPEAKQPPELLCLHAAQVLERDVGRPTEEAAVVDPDDDLQEELVSPAHPDGVEDAGDVDCLSQQCMAEEDYSVLT